MKQLLRLVICCGLLGAVGASGGAEGEIDPRWLDRMAPEDRACLDRLIGYAPPAFPDESVWVNGEPMTWGELRGRVVVVQSWTSRTAAGRNWALRASRTLGGFDERDVQVIALHTPEGAETAGVFLKRRPHEVPVVIDHGGLLCDALGMYRRPVNVVVDRNGTVRFAGLNQRGLKAAVARLVTEAPDPKAAPAVRPADGAAEAASFPPFTGSIRSATDVRGQRAPRLVVQQWLNEEPSAAGKVVVLDFWATGCGYCRRTIPHLNTLADQFRDDVVCIGLSDETRDNFLRGLQRYRLAMNDFRYHLALDSASTMKRAIKSRGVPHTIVMSSDWIVRWQGHPAFLKAETLARIVEANSALAGGNGPRCERWKGGGRD
ncbi:MAG: TlpA family protein disulfide reductase [Planctomycetota bacterium]